MFKNRLFRKIIATYLALIIASLGLLSIVAIEKFSQSYQDEISRHLANTAYMVRTFIKDCSPEPNKINEHITELGKDIQTRITVIDRNGNVLADSGYDRTTMENHNDRPEVISARQNKIGQNIRYSHTPAIDMIYLAIPLDNNKPGDVIIRVSLPLKQVSLITGHIYQTVGIIFIFALLMALIMGLWIVSRIVRPVNEMVSVAESISRGDLSARVTATSKDEVGQLAQTINLMGEELQKRFSEISREKATFNIVLSSVREGVIAIDANLKVIFANTAVGHLFAVDTNQIVDKYLWEVVRDNNLIGFVKDCLTGPSTALAHKDITSPKNKPLRIYCLPIKATPGSFLVVIYDISESMKYEQLRKDFVANVSHELRTPLTFIKGYVETLREHNLGDQAKILEFLDIIDKNVRQLTNLVEDLLELSRLESSEGITRIRPIKPAKVINDAINYFQPAIEKKQHAVIKNIQADCPEILTDPDMLAKAVGNLLDNAVKYTPENGRIEITVAADAQNLSISIKDNGIGIPSEDLAQIFERFYRVDKSRSREMGGTGLGLSIVKHIVQTLKGDVSVTSKPEQGSTFVIKLPVTHR